MREIDELKKSAAEKQEISEQALAEQAVRKRLREMNLLDDFLFSSVVSYPEIGERFVKILLKTIFGREFRRLSVTVQKALYGVDTGLHGARLDVYIEPEGKDPEGNVTVYDIEPDRNSMAKDRKILPRRVRFYHGKIIARSLNAGKGYEELKNVVVIMILPYDPFGLGRMVYTVKNKCMEEPGMEYEDGASTLYLYTKGTKGVPNEALKQLLHYMEETTGANAVNNDLREVHEMIEVIKIDPETTISCVRLTEKLYRSKMEGETKKLVSQVCKKMKKNKTVEKIAEELEDEVSAIEPIYNVAKGFAPEYDPKLVFEQFIRETGAERRHSPSSYDAL